MSCVAFYGVTVAANISGVEVGPKTLIKVRSMEQGKPYALFDGSGTRAI